MLSKNATKIISIQVFISLGLIFSTVAFISAVFPTDVYADPGGGGGIGDDGTGGAVGTDIEVSSSIDLSNGVIQTNMDHDLGTLSLSCTDGSTPVGTTVCNTASGNDNSGFGSSCTTTYSCPTICPAGYTGTPPNCLVGGTTPPSGWIKGVGCELPSAGGCWIGAAWGTANSSATEVDIGAPYGGLFASFAPQAPSSASGAGAQPTVAGYYWYELYNYSSGKGVWLSQSSAPVYPYSQNNVTASCNVANNGQVSLSWPAANGATKYYPYIQAGDTTAWPSGCPAGFTMWSDGKTCYIPGGTTSMSFSNLSITPGRSYAAYVYTGDPVSPNAPPVTNFTCGVPVSCTPPSEIPPFTVKDHNGPTTNGCLIQANASTCDIDATWNTQNSQYTYNGVTAPYTGVVMYTNPGSAPAGNPYYSLIFGASSGTATFTETYGKYWAQMDAYNSCANAWAQLDINTVTAKCTPGTAWDSTLGICNSNVPTPPQINYSCTTQNFTWGNATGGTPPYNYYLKLWSGSGFCPSGWTVSAVDGNACIPTTNPITGNSIVAALTPGVTYHASLQAGDPINPLASTNIPNFSCGVPTNVTGSCTGTTGTMSWTPAAGDTSHNLLIHLESGGTCPAGFPSAGLGNCIKYVYTGSSPVTFDAVPGNSYHVEVQSNASGGSSAYVASGIFTCTTATPIGGACNVAPPSGTLNSPLIGWSAAPSGGVGPYSWSWTGTVNSTAANSVNYTATSPGTYNEHIAITDSTGATFAKDCPASVMCAADYNQTCSLTNPSCPAQPATTGTFDCNGTCVGTAPVCPVLPPSPKINAYPSNRVRSGDNAQVNWECFTDPANQTQCPANSGISCKLTSAQSSQRPQDTFLFSSGAGVTAMGGSHAVNNITGQTTYTYTCTNSAGSASQSTTFTLIPTYIPI
jgi:hypothetical protein